MKAYYKEKSFLGRIYWAFRHPKRQWAWVGYYGVRPILSTILFGGILPPPFLNGPYRKVGRVNVGSQLQTQNP